MESIFVEDFKLRFTASTIPGLDNYVDIIEPCINEEHNSLLNKPILEADVLEAVKSIGALKAPGPDGIHAYFIKIVGTLWALQLLK
ncbi:hypothetical protein ACFX2K_022836 [Malus domestica]